MVDFSVRREKENWGGGGSCWANCMKRIAFGRSMTTIAMKKYEEGWRVKALKIWYCASIQYMAIETYSVDVNS